MLFVYVMACNLFAWILQKKAQTPSPLAPSICSLRLVCSCKTLVHTRFDFQPAGPHPQPSYQPEGLKNNYLTTSQSFTRPSLLVAVDYSAYYSAEPLSLNFYTVLRPDGFAQKQIPHLITLFRNDLLDQVFYQVIVSPLHQVQTWSCCSSFLTPFNHCFCQPSHISLDFMSSSTLCWFIQSLEITSQVSRTFSDSYMPRTIS
jgi:hypothetical protein